MTLKRVRVCLHSMYVQGSSCTYSVDLYPSHVSPACQAEENVVCNFKCMTTQLSHGCHLNSRSAVSDAGVYLPSSQSSLSSAVHPLTVVDKMPGAPTRSTADNMTAARQKVGSPAILGANPDSHILRDHEVTNRMDMFNGIFSLYMNGRFFRQKDVKKSSGQRTQQHSQSCLLQMSNGMSSTFARCRRCSPCCFAMTTVHSSGPFDGTGFRVTLS